MTSQGRRTSRVAVLVFAGAVDADLARRGWSRRMTPLLRMPGVLRRGLAGTDVHLFTDAGGAARAKCAAGVRLHLQRGASFGERLESAVETLADAGYERVVIVGRDCPGLTASDIRAAERGLDHHRLVLGPDHRGGCYLIALRSADRAILAGIPWQRDVDRAALVRRCGAGDVALLVTRCDVDGWADVTVLAAGAGRAAALAGRILNDVRMTPMPGRPDDPRPVTHIDRGRSRWQTPPPGGFPSRDCVAA